MNEVSCYTLVIPALILAEAVSVVGDHRSDMSVESCASRYDAENSLAEGRLTWTRAHAAQTRARLSAHVFLFREGRMLDVSFFTA